LLNITFLFTLCFPWLTINPLYLFYTFYFILLYSLSRSTYKTGTGARYFYSLFYLLYHIYKFNITIFIEMSFDAGAKSDTEFHSLNLTLTLLPVPEFVMKYGAEPEMTRSENACLPEKLTMVIELYIRR
jgi:hypothetical protein